MKERIQSTEEKNTMLTDLNMVHSMISLHEKTNKLKSGDGQEPLVLSHSKSEGPVFKSICHHSSCLFLLEGGTRF